jgi:hypothetical protein
MRFFFCAAVAALTLTGCGAKVAHFASRAVSPVEGQFIWKGKPLEGASVVFYPVGWSLDPGTSNPAGLTGHDGRFKLTTYKTDDGAPPGKYAVTVVKRVPGKSSMFGPNPLPKKYSSPNTTTWQVEIEEGKNVIPPFEVKGESGKS